jgi:exodeoxyribonuclease VII small subunit
MATAEVDVSQLSFEAALARLEEIVRTLEKGEAPLDRSIELYQEGDRLKRVSSRSRSAATASRRG